MLTLGELRYTLDDYYVDIDCDSLFQVLITKCAELNQLWYQGEDGEPWDYVDFCEAYLGYNPYYADNISDILDTLEHDYAYEFNRETLFDDCTVHAIKGDFDGILIELNSVEFGMVD